MAYTKENLLLGSKAALAACAVMLLACLGQAYAVGPLVGDPAAYNDGSGPNGGAWSGTQTIPTTLNTLQVDVDFAVYAPGTLGNSSLFSAGDVPASATEFVYVYQVRNTAGGTSALATLTVGLGDLFFHPLIPPGGNDGFDEELPSNDGWVTGFGDVDPAFSVITPNDIDRDPLAQGILWDFNGGLGLPVGQSSSMLVFTATGGPEWDLASIAGGGGSVATGILPSPTQHMPEPSTLVLGLLASLGMLRRQK